MLLFGIGGKRIGHHRLSRFGVHPIQNRGRTLAHQQIGAKSHIQMPRHIAPQQSRLIIAPFHHTPPMQWNRRDKHIRRNNWCSRPRHPTRRRANHIHAIPMFQPQDQGPRHTAIDQSGPSPRPGPFGGKAIVTNLCHAMITAHHRHATTIADRTRNKVDIRAAFATQPMLFLDQSIAT